MTRGRATRQFDAEGFTFIEVLQALALSAIGLLALSSLTMGTISANAKARRITTAATLGQAKMEEIRNLAYGAVAEGADQVTESNVHYARAWEVCTNCPIQGTKEITLTVTWLEQVDQTVKLQTIISE
jgi:prepilin-type N-terminal cleavage/methylation domain-containing protein